MDLEKAIVALLVAAALLYAIRRIYRTWSRAGCSSCASQCPGCRFDLPDPKGDWKGGSEI